MEEFVESVSICDPEVYIIDSREQTRSYVDDVLIYKKETVCDDQINHEECKDNLETESFISHPEKVVPAIFQPKKSLIPDVSVIQQPKSHQKITAKSEIPNENVPHHAFTVNSDPTTEISQPTNYILKKNLMLSKITTFDDRPEHYETWKYSFKSVCLDLNLNSPEELDIIIRWFGPTSVTYARSIQSFNHRQS